MARHSWVHPNFTMRTRLLRMAMALSFPRSQISAQMGGLAGFGFSPGQCMGIGEIELVRERRRRFSSYLLPRHVHYHTVPSRWLRASTHRTLPHPLQDLGCKNKTVYATWVARFRGLGARYHSHSIHSQLSSLTDRITTLVVTVPVADHRNQVVRPVSKQHSCEATSLFREAAGLGQVSLMGAICMSMSP